MDNIDLPTIPTNLTFKFKKHTIDELCTLWDTKRSTMCDRLSRIKDLLGVRIGHDYSAEQVIIMCMVWEPPELYYHAFKFMETRGWTDYIAKKYNLAVLLEQKNRNKLLQERFAKKKRKK